MEGDAWSKAGCIVAAAEAWLSASEGESLRRATELRLRAAERLMRGGQLERGEVLMNEVLHTVGLPSIPKSTTANVAAIVVQRALLKLRGFRFHKREEREIDGAELLRVDAARAAGLALSQIATIRSVAFSARNVRLALRAGEPRRIARALTLESAFRSAAGRDKAAECEALLARARRLVDFARAPAEQTVFVPSAECCVAAFTGNLSCAVQTGTEVLRTYEHIGMDDAVECTMVRTYLAIAHGMLGHPQRMREVITGRANAAALRGDRYSAATLARLEAWALAEMGYVQEACAELQRAREHAPNSGHGLHGAFLVELEARLLLAQGEAQAAWALQACSWRGLVRSGVTRIACLAFYAHLSRALAALAVARLRTAEGNTSKKIAKQSAAMLSRIPYPGAAAASASISASLASLRDDMSDARQRLQAAAELYAKEGMGLYAAAAVVRLADLIGGAEASRFKDRAIEQMRERGVAEPHFATSMLVPDCNPPAGRRARAETPGPSSGSNTNGGYLP
jgi:hypothetical protein